MLSDRSYMRSDYSAPRTSVLTWMLCGMTAAFLLNLVLRVWLHTNVLEDGLALTPAGLRHGQVWTLVTYALLHSDIMHLLFNGLGLFFIGRELIGPLGSGRFLGLGLASTLAAGLVWFLCHFNQGGLNLVGASGMVASLFIVFACIYPEKEVTFLLFFVLPLTLKPKILAGILVAVDLIGFLFSELPGGKFDTGIAHSAHLGGMLAGLIFYRYFYAARGLDRASAFSLPAWLQRRPKASQSADPSRRVDLKHGSSLRLEVDRILDKINSQGFGALTDEEKRLLDEAKDMLSRR